MAGSLRLPRTSPTIEPRKPATNERRRRLRRAPRPPQGLVRAGARVGRAGEDEEQVARAGSGMRARSGSRDWLSESATAGRSARRHDRPGDMEARRGLGAAGEHEALERLEPGVHEVAELLEPLDLSLRSPAGARAARPRAGRRGRRRGRRGRSAICSSQGRNSPGGRPRGARPRNGVQLVDRRRTPRCGGRSWRRGSRRRGSSRPRLRPACRSASAVRARPGVSPRGEYREGPRRLAARAGDRSRARSRS